MLSASLACWREARMPWSEKSIMSQRREFVMLFGQDGVNRRELCRRFGISPTIGYRLLARYRQEGEAGLADRSRRPQRSPARTSAEMEGLVLAVRTSTRPGAAARSVAGCRISATKRRRAPAPSPQSCTAMIASMLPRAPSTGHLNGLSGRYRTSCGRWTTRDIFRSPLGAATR